MPRLSYRQDILTSVEDLFYFDALLQLTGLSEDGVVPDYIDEDLRDKHFKFVVHPNDGGSLHRRCGSHGAVGIVGVGALFGG
jgi:hypothetical protein